MLRAVTAVVLSAVLAIATATATAVPVEHEQEHEHEHEHEQESAAAAEWAQFDAVFSTADGTVDGEMHWLREVMIRKVNTIDNADRQRGVLLAAAAGLYTGAAAVQGIRPEPCNYAGNAALVPIITPAQLEPWAVTLTQAQRDWVTAHHVVINALNGAVAAVKPATAAFANCDQDVFNGLVAAGAAQVGIAPGDPPATKAAAQLHAMGGVAVCDINVPLATVQLWTNLMINNAAQWAPLGAHYHRLRHYTGAATYDIWLLRGWLYATDRLNGHRLKGATGYADAAVAGPDAAIPEMRWIRVKSAAGAQTFGYDHDTVGHVRPKSLGGMRDPLNFVPQSKTGQKVVNVAEELALALVTYCHAHNPTNVRYGIVFTYHGNTPADRRPSAAETWVDLANGCNAETEFGGAPVAAGTPMFHWAHTTY